MFPLVVGIDGSEASLEAVDWAADAALRHEVPLHLVHVAAADALRSPAQRCEDVQVSSRIVEGPARQALLDAAAGADLLVVGARRRHGRVGLQLGLVNHAVPHHAPCPIDAFASVLHRPPRDPAPLLGGVHRSGEGGAGGGIFGVDHVDEA